MVVFSAGCKPSDFAADSLNILHRLPDDTIMQFNQAGSFGLYFNGIKATVQRDNYNLFASYSYRNYSGFRVHSNEYAHTLNLMVETTPSVNTQLQIVGYYFNGQEKRPGSLTKSEFGQDPFQADPRAVNRDEKRITSKGQMEINFMAMFGKSLNQKITVSAYGKIENYIRATREFKIISRYGLGLTAGYTYTCRVRNRANELSVGGNLYIQPERMEEYENFSGQKSDWIDQIKNEKTNSSSCYISDNFELVKKKLYLQLTGKYDNVVYRLKEETLPSRADKKTYHAFTPEIGLTYKVTRAITLFTSYGWSFKSPTDKELDSFYPAFLYNQDLMAQTSKTFEAGINGDMVKKDSSVLFRKLHFNALFFRTNIEHEIVPYEIYGDEFFRNATKTTRYGFEAGSSLEIYTDLVFSVAWTYSFFIYDEYTADAIETDPTGNIVSIYRDFAGNTEPNIPRNNLNMSLSYKHPAGKKTGIFALLSYQYISGLWVDDTNTGQTSSYNLVNTILGFDMKFGHFIISASGGINNIFDQIYVGYANINSADRRFYDAGAPRNFTGSLNFGYVF